MGAVRPQPSAPPRLCVLVLLLLLLGFSVSPSAAWDLVLLHTNDVHARVEETTEHSGKCVGSSQCFAGVARRATEVQRVRGSESNVLLLDAGDQFQGTVWFNYYRGAEAAHFMNRLRYDAMALGNHEFDNGVDGLMKPFMQKIQCPVLSANIKPDKTLAPTFGTSYLPYKILTVGDQKVGVVGYTSRETSDLSRPGTHLRFEDEVNALQPHVDKLQTLGVNKIIALGHSGFTMDREIAKKVRGVDVVIGGHTNTFLYTAQQLHPIPRWRRVEPRQRLHLQRRRRPGIYRRTHQERLDHDGGPDLRPTLRGNLRPGAAERLHAEESLRTRREATWTEHRRIPPSVRVPGRVGPHGTCGPSCEEPQHPVHQVSRAPLRTGAGRVGLQSGAAVLHGDGRRRVLHDQKRDAQTQQRGSGHFSHVRIHRSEEESLSVRRGTNQDLQLGLRTAGTNRRTGFTSTDAALDRVTRRGGPDLFYKLVENVKKKRLWWM
ncbi:5'-nucleotidase isoform X2 [Scophthalmus maximus]|uniref:5'-nucleotidase isoform X2 n=1 Tax=Scophthalmus maximus TaxID=52904 RepID=UPI001FA8CD02|nr:5'-nucleotidase isoform X2 [Scophthalmus maximus]